MGVKTFVSKLALVATLLLPSNFIQGINVFSSTKGVNLQELAQGYSHSNPSSLSGVKLTFNGEKNSQLTLETIGTNEVEGVILEGSFEVPLKIWKDRWDAYTCSTNTQVDSSITNSLLGIYLQQPFKVNRQSVWRQPSGKNFIWFGDICNPRDSFDAWYVGQYPAGVVPRANKSIPITPTFLPNHLGEGIDKIYQPWLRASFPGEPHVKKTKVGITHSYRFSKEEPFRPITNNIVQNISGDQINSLELLSHYSTSDQSSSFDETVSLKLETFFIKDIKKIPEGVKLIWSAYDNYLYNVLRTPQLNTNTVYSVIGTNIPGVYPETEFIDLNPFPSNGFYKIEGQERP